MHNTNAVNQAKVPLHNEQPYMLVCTYTCIHAHTHTYKHTRIHTYTHKHIHKPRESHSPPSYEWQRTDDHPVTVVEQMHQYV